MFEVIMQIITGTVIFILVARSVLKWFNRPSSNTGSHLTKSTNGGGNITLNVLLAFAAFMIWMAFLFLDNMSNPRNAFGFTFSLILGGAALLFALLLLYVLFNANKPK